MKKSTLSKLGMLVAGGWLATGVAVAEQPIEPPQSGPQTGGIPQCQADLADAQAFPATGQQSCWDTFGNLLESCEGTGHDGDIQAGAPIDAESSYTVTDETIIDNNTKLEWMKQDDNDTGCEIYPGNLDKDCTFTWADAFNFVASLNAADHAGGGWRVPNVKELQSIVNYENFGPAVSVEFNTGCAEPCTVDACSCTGAALYWSSTSIAFNPIDAWNVDFNGGDVDFGSKGSDRRVRAVRGGL